MHEVDIEKAIFLNKTWMNENMRKETGWTNGTVRALSVLHWVKANIWLSAGGTSGWINTSPLVFELKKIWRHKYWSFLIIMLWSPSSSHFTRISYCHGQCSLLRQNKRYPTKIIIDKRRNDQLASSWGMPFPGDLHKRELYELVWLHKPTMPTCTINKEASRWVSDTFHHITATTTPLK